MKSTKEEKTSRAKAKVFSVLVPGELLYLMFCFDRIVFTVVYILQSFPVSVFSI